jgi:hypothetical protein
MLNAAGVAKSTPAVYSLTWKRLAHGDTPSLLYAKICV